MTGLEYVQNYGAVLGLMLYILIQNVIPFLRDKYWPSLQEDKQANMLHRRESDNRLIELEERRVIANEQVAKNLILLTQKTTYLEAEIRRHDDHMTAVIGQMTNTLSSMQAINNILLDRVVRPQVTTEDILRIKSELQKEN